MDALRRTVCVLALSVVGCAATPRAATVAPVSVARVDAARFEAVVDPFMEKSTTLAQLVSRVRADAKTALVVTKNGKASAAVATLERAGMDVTTTDRDFARMRRDAFRPYDVVVLEKAPDEHEGEVADDTAQQHVPVIATWKGDTKSEAAMKRRYDASIRLAESKPGEVAQFAVWMFYDYNAPTRPVIRAGDLGLRPVKIASGVAIADDGTASIVGTLRRLPAGGIVIEAGNASIRTMATLEGDAAGSLLPSGMASVRGRIRFAAATSGTNVWSLELTHVDAYVDEKKMHALTSEHAKVYDRGVQHVARGELALAADDLEKAAGVFDDALAGKGADALRAVRFDRLMATRLREVAAEGGSAEALLERVAHFETMDMMERDLLVAAGKHARAKLLKQYRAARNADEAERIAHVYLYTVEVVRGAFPEPSGEMMNRFASLRSGGRWRPEPFYRDGEARIAD